MNTNVTYETVENLETFERMLARVREAQKIYASYTQEQVDKIFRAAAMAANLQRIPLAKMAVEETGMGVVEDKVIKNHYAPSTSTTPTRIRRPAVSSRKTRRTASKRLLSPSVSLVLSSPLPTPPLLLSSKP